MGLNLRKRAGDNEGMGTRSEPSARQGTFKLKSGVKSKGEPGTDQAPPPSPEMVDEVIVKPPLEKPKARLTADVDHATYVRIKTFAADTRKPLVSIIEELINTYCVR